MKRIIFLVITCVLASMVKAQEGFVKEEDPAATAVFNRVTHDFGTVSESEGIVECEFALTNAGDSPLVITKVTASCGCTVSDWTKEPVAAGKQGFVKVLFDPKGRKGEFTRSLTVFTSGNPPSIRLKITGKIE